MPGRRSASHRECFAINSNRLFRAPFHEKRAACFSDAAAFCSQNALSSMSRFIAFRRASVSIGSCITAASPATSGSDETLE